MANRLSVAKVHSILTLHARGWSCRRIATTLGVDRETVGRYVRQARAPDPKPATADRSPTADAAPNGTHNSIEADSFSERQRWVLAQLAADVKLTRRAIQERFNVSDRTAKRDLGELSDAGLTEYEDKAKPGYYRLTRIAATLRLPWARPAHVACCS